MDYFYPVGATPLDPDEKEGLIPGHLKLQKELNEWEQQNILQAKLWLQTKNLDLNNILVVHFLYKLHKKMFDETWMWAGKFRQTEKNIGVLCHEIPEKLHQLIGDVKFWIENETYPEDEICVRLHHRLVSIHCFPNGNGRHSRIYSELVLEALGQPKFTWGKTDLTSSSEVRQKYIEALKLADKHEYNKLLEFVRS